MQICACLNKGKTGQFSHLYLFMILNNFLFNINSSLFKYGLTLCLVVSLNLVANFFNMVVVVEIIGGHA